MDISPISINSTTPTTTSAVQRPPAASSAPVGGRRADGGDFGHFDRSGVSKSSDVRVGFDVGTTTLVVRRQAVVGDGMRVILPVGYAARDRDGDGVAEHRSRRSISLLV